MNCVFFVMMVSYIVFFNYFYAYFCHGSQQYANHCVYL